MALSRKWQAVETRNRQLTLFDGPIGLAISRPIARPEPVGSVARALADRDQAMQQAADRAEAAAPGFQTLARAFVVGWLRSHSAGAGEDITDACKAAGIVPHDDRAFGAVYQGLVRQGVIQKCGSCPRRKGHATAGGVVWRLRT